MVRKEERKRKEPEGRVRDHGWREERVRVEGNGAKERKTRVSGLEESEL